MFINKKKFVHWTIFGSSVHTKTTKDEALLFFPASGQKSQTFISNFSSLNLSLCSRFSYRQSHYSSVEVSFAHSWLNSAEYVAAARFQTNMEKAVLFLTPLPSRILQVHIFNLFHLFILHITSFFLKHTKWEKAFVHSPFCLIILGGRQRP